MHLPTNHQRKITAIFVASLFIAGCSSGSGDGLDENGSPVDEAPESPVAEEPIVDAPDAPVVEEPVVDAPEAPVAEEPIVDAPEAPVVEEPVVDAPEEPVVEEPVVDAPEEPVADVVSAFAEIQSTVFTPICSECHGPIAPSAGLQLNAADSFAAIVGVPSNQVPSLNRIAPGDPDNSYLIMKLEGTQAVGSQMPLGGPPLPQDTIDFIRQWVTDGALPATPDALAFASRVVSASVDENATLNSMPSSISIVWSSPIDPTSFSSDTVSLLRSGGDGSFTDGNEVSVDVVMSETSNPFVTTLATTNESIDDRFQLTINGDGDIHARSSDARPIDGNTDGSAGGDFVRIFTITNP